MSPPDLPDDLAPVASAPIEPSAEVLSELKARIECLKTKTGPAKDEGELRSTFREMVSLLEDLQAMAGVHADEELKTIVKGLQAFEKIISGDSTKATQGVEQLFGIPSFKRFIFDKVFSNMPTALDKDAVEKVRGEFAALPEVEQNQAMYLQKLVLTDDAFGIIVRGHVLIENALQSCIYAYVPDPIDLYAKLELFFSQKIRLAQMIGVISSDEASILAKFNALRNKIAHHGKGIANPQPDFQLTPEHERLLWEAFTQNPSMAGAWPPYDTSKFPTHLRYIVMHLWVVLNTRKHELAKRKLRPIVTELTEQPDTLILSHLTMLMVNWQASIGELGG